MEALNLLSLIAFGVSLICGTLWCVMEYAPRLLDRIRRIRFNACVRALCSIPTAKLMLDEDLNNWEVCLLRKPAIAEIVNEDISWLLAPAFQENNIHLQFIEYVEEEDDRIQQTIGI